MGDIGGTEPAVLSNGTITTLIEGVEVSVRAHFYPSAEAPTTLQLRAKVPVFEGGVFAHWVISRCSLNLVRAGKYGYMLVQKAAVRNAELIELVKADQAVLQRKHDTRFERERDELVECLDSMSRQQTRKTELDAIIAAGDK